MQQLSLLPTSSQNSNTSKANPAVNSKGDMSFKDVLSDKNQQVMSDKGADMRAERAAVSERTEDGSSIFNPPASDNASINASEKSAVLNTSEEAVGEQLPLNQQSLPTVEADLASIAGENALSALSDSDHSSLNQGVASVSGELVSKVQGMRVVNDVPQTTSDTPGYSANAPGQGMSGQATGVFVAPQFSINGQNAVELNTNAAGAANANTPVQAENALLTNIPQVKDEGSVGELSSVNKPLVGLSNAGGADPESIASSGAMQGNITASVKALEGLAGGPASERAAQIVGSGAVGLSGQGGATEKLADLSSAEFGKAGAGEQQSLLTRQNESAQARFSELLQAISSGESADGADASLPKTELLSSVSQAKGADVAKVVETSSARPYVSSLGLPVSDNEWASQLGQKIMWMGAKNIQSAELHLNPADLGPIEVRIQIGSDQTSINFNAQNASVRELLEANIHRLREMLNAGSNDQSDRNMGQQDGQGQPKSFSGGAEQDGQGSYVVSALNATGESSSELDGTSNAVTKPYSDSLVDDYA